MTRKYNFSAGPATLPFSVLEQIRDEIVEFKGSGMSLIEASHRGKEYDAVHGQAMQVIRDLLGLPDNFKVVFLGGGATLQFSMVPMNLLGDGRSCDFTVSGSWAKKAYADAKLVGEVNVAWDGKPDNYTRLPRQEELVLDPDAAYFHLTSNETIQGCQWHAWPDTGNVPIIADMSSDMMSRRLPLEKFGLIYAGAQKNLGPAGVALVLIRDDILDRCRTDLTAYLQYKIHASKESMYNTPPVFSIYALKLVMEWLKGLGGLPAAEELANKRAGILYDAMGRSGGFYRCPVAPEYRSLMNVVFRLPTEPQEQEFIRLATESGLSGLKGHRSVGGCRASIYNAMPVEGAQKLAELMDEFARTRG